MSEREQREQQERDYSDTQAGKGEEKQHEGKPPTPHSVFYSQSSEGRSAGDQEQKAQGYFWQQWNTMEKFTFWLMIFTAIYAGTSIWQFAYIIEKDRLDQRAWVGVADVVKPPTLEAGVPMMLGVTIINNGKTPAREVTGRDVVVSVKAGKDISSFYSSAEEKPSGILQPGARKDTTSQTIIPQVEIDAVRTGTRILYFLGKISYEDVFGRAYCYTYCTYVDRNLIHMRDCVTHNDETEGRCK